MTTPIATIYTEGGEFCLSLDEVKIRLASGQLGQDARIDCPVLTGGKPRPIWMIESLREYANTPEARMMDHLRSKPTPYVAIALMLGMMLMWILQGRGWISSVNAGLGWSSISIQNHWWAPWLHWGVHVDLAHWIGNAGLLYFCTRRVERVVGSISVIWVLSWILWGISLAVWQWETHLVIGASSWVFGMWAMQVGLGFRLADSLPRSVQAHYGWSNFLIFVPMVVLNTLSVDISNIAHWMAILIGVGLSIWMTPYTSRRSGEQHPRQSLGQNILCHGVFALCMFALTEVDSVEGVRTRLSNGLMVVQVPNLLQRHWCGMDSWQQDGVILYAGEHWYTQDAIDQSFNSKNVDACVVSEATCVRESPERIQWWKEEHGPSEWTVRKCSNTLGVTNLEYQVQRGSYGVRIGCTVWNNFALDWCKQWLNDVVLDQTISEYQAAAHWVQHDQSGGKTLEYAQLLQLYGRWEEVDGLYEGMEDRFDDYRWRATEERLRMHRGQQLDWIHEQLWLEQVGQSLPVDEIEVLRQSVLLANDRGWCDVSQNIWLRWRTMMSTGLDDIGILAKECGR